MSCPSQVTLSPVNTEPKQKIKVLDSFVLTEERIALLKEEIKTKFPQPNYGYKNLLLSAQHGIGYQSGAGDYFITGARDLAQGYNCYEINRVLTEIAKKHGYPAFLVKGVDEKNIFTEHYFTVIDNQPLDAVECFPFHNAKHKFVSPKKQGHFVAAERGRGSVHNPIEIINAPHGQCTFGINEILFFSSAHQARLSFYCSPFEKQKKTRTGLFRLAFFTSHLRRDFGQYTFEEVITNPEIQTKILEATEYGLAGDPENTNQLLQELPTICALIYKITFPEKFPR